MGNLEQRNKMPREVLKVVGSGGKRWPIIGVWVLVLAYATLFTALTIQRHDAFQSTDFELGNLSQIAWNNLHGAPFIMTNPEGAQPENSLGIHVWPILLPISLIYLVWPDPRALLVLQAAIVALGAWPVFWLSRRALARASLNRDGTQQADWLALVFVVAYLMFPALQAANRFDFHPVTLATTLLLMAFWGLENGQWGRFAVWAVLAMACKEDVALLVVMLGLYALLVRRKCWPGLITVAVGIAWFWLAVGVILPHFDVAGASPFGYRYSYLGNNLGEIALTFLTRPSVVMGYLLTGENWAYVRDLLAPVAFLSLLAPQVLVLALPAVLENLLSLKVQMHQLEGFQYSVMLVPFVVISAAYGVGWLSRRLSRWRLLPYVLAALVLGATLAYHVGHGQTPLARNFQWPEVTEHHRLGMAMAKGIPPGAAVSALPRLFPHVSSRRYVYAVNRWDGNKLAQVEGADYVWLDVTNFWPLHPNDLRAGVEELLVDGYGVVEATDGWLLLSRSASEKGLPPAFYDFARVADPQPQYPMQLQFLLDGEPVLECLGFDLTEQPDGWQLAFFWRALRPLPEGLRLYPFYLDDATGRVLEDATQRPMVASVWYPPSVWQPGEVIRTETLPWDVGNTYSVGLGVVQGDDWEEVGRRLPIRVESSHLVVRLFDNDTWARLLHVEEGQVVEEVRRFDTPVPQVAVDVDFDVSSESPSQGLIRLLGYDLDCTQRQAACDLDLDWKALERIEGSYTVFAQLLDPAGTVRAQWDSVPQSGGYPTQWWLPGEIVQDPVRLELAADAPRGVAYRLIAGLYDPSTGNRLLVVGTGADHVELAAIDL